MVIEPIVEPFTISLQGDSPLLATAIHDGHDVRSSLKGRFQLSEEERFREEDPFTGRFIADLPATQVVVHRSRFEVDLNRPRPQAVYQKPEDAWGLHIWKNPLPEDEINKSLAIYDTFYSKVQSTVENIIRQNGGCLIYDVHSYNHQRSGPGNEAPQKENPDINLGVGNTNTSKWQPVIDAFIHSWQHRLIGDRQVDIRTNVKFKGGYFTKWLHQHFGDRVCCLAIEFKKIFMDEWTGALNPPVLNALKEGMVKTVQPTLLAFEKNTST